MCGFFGIIHGRTYGSDELAEKKREWLRAASCVAYRGRDEYGEYADDHSFFTHYRLSIIDLSQGQQPMKDASGRHVILFNGELYNYIELRKELLAQGVRFQTESDTEVLLAGLIHEGPRFLERTEGMFSVVLWDAEKRTLLLARDPLGKKPLNIWESPNGDVAFSSSLDSFTKLKGWDGKLEKAAIGQFVYSGAVMAPLTIYENARKVLPGGYEIYDERRRGWTKASYASLRFSNTRRRVTEEEMYDELGRSLNLRMRSDVPVGMTFSGGVDSGLLGCLARDGSYDVSLFNIDYESDTDFSPERRNARIASKRLGLGMIEENFPADDIFTGLTEAYAPYDEPCNQMALVYCRQINKIIRDRDIKVVITGNGADELFLGYRGNHVIRRRSDLMRYGISAAPASLLPEKVRVIKKEGWAGYGLLNEKNRIAAFSNAMKWSRADQDRYQVFLDPFHHALQSASIERYSDYVVWCNLFHYAGASNYVVPDISGLDSQVEIRSPFLDWRFVQTMANVEESQRIGSYFTSRHNKALLKKTYAHKLGKDLAYDTKRGMGWNIRWDMWIIHEPVIRKMFEASLNLLSDYGVSSQWFLDHFNRYAKSDRWAGPGGGEAVSGFMLALWLKKEFEGQDALAEWMAPIKGFTPSRRYD